MVYRWRDSFIDECDLDDFVKKSSKNFALIMSVVGVIACPVSGVILDFFNNKFRKFRKHLGLLAATFYSVTVGLIYSILQFPKSEISQVWKFSIELKSLIIPLFRFSAMLCLDSSHLRYLTEIWLISPTHFLLNFMAAWLEFRKFFPP